MSISTTVQNNFYIFGTWEENHYDPQKSLELFYYSLNKKHRLSMPYEYRDEFTTRGAPDYNDQFVFFMLAFFDNDIKKTEKQQINLWFSALLALLEINHAPWINQHSIERIKEELLNLLKSKSYDESIKIFEELVPDSVKRLNLMMMLRIKFVIINQQYWA